MVWYKIVLHFLVIEHYLMPSNIYWTQKSQVRNLKVPSFTNGSAWDLKICSDRNLWCMYLIWIFGIELLIPPNGLVAVSVSQNRSFRYSSKIPLRQNCYLFEPMTRDYLVGYMIKMKLSQDQTWQPIHKLY